MLCDVKHCDENCGDIGQSQENLGGGGGVALGRHWRTFGKLKKTMKDDRDIDKMFGRC
jgi:hypothetical protein